MKCAILVLVLVTFSSANPTPPAQEITSPRSATEIGETIKQLTNQLMEVNTTSEIMMDTRTPPKIKQHAKKKPKPQPQPDFESSHAGVAIPIDEDDLMEETTKKLSFYKFERPTTNSGLSTWILLSGQTTPKPSKKPVVKPNESQNTTLVVEPNKIIKPIFKKRVSTTRKPTTQRTTRITTEATPKTTKLNKIKASILNNAKKTTIAPSTTRESTIAPKKNATIIGTSKKTTTTVSTATTPKTATTTLKTSNATLSTNSSSSTLPLEAKEGGTELEKTNKTKTTTPKRKKNKHRRKRPESKNSTKIEKSASNKHKTKENPISTQFYNYLQREVMPTVGVGLVGLMVTAGLASYFLYPFGAARRSYDIDRKDKEGSYYYSDQYSGGIAEEEAIGKVIAGMPENSLYSTYKAPSSRKSFSNRQVNNNHRVTQGTVSQGSVETVALNDYNSYQPVTYNSNKETYNSNKERANVEKETQYTVDDRKFVVGNAPKEDVTPAAVPEHGPRSLRIRREVKIPEDEENEIELEEGEDQQENEIKEEVTTVAAEEATTTTTTTTEKPEDSVLKFAEFFRDLVHFKVNVGLQFVQRAADALSKYASEMQGAVDEHYKNTTMRNKGVKQS